MGESMNSMWQRFVRAGVVFLAALAIGAGVSVAPAPAQAVAISCKVYAPSQRADRSLDLLM